MKTQDPYHGLGRQQSSHDELQLRHNAIAIAVEELEDFLDVRTVRQVLRQTLKLLLGVRVAEPILQLRLGDVPV